VPEELPDEAPDDDDAPDEVPDDDPPEELPLLLAPPPDEPPPPFEEEPHATPNADAEASAETKRAIRNLDMTVTLGGILLAARGNGVSVRSLHPFDDGTDGHAVGKRRD
jgi:hypothetical protein